MSADAAPLPLKEQFTRGLDAPICLTWELTYACNLACVHCLSSSGRRDPGELTPDEARGIVDDMVAMKVFYVNIGGGEPMLRPDFFDLVSYAVGRKVGVKFSTNGTRLTPQRAQQLVKPDPYQPVQAGKEGDGDDNQVHLTTARQPMGPIFVIGNLRRELLAKHSQTKPDRGPRPAKVKSY